MFLNNDHSEGELLNLQQACQSRFSMREEVCEQDSWWQSHSPMRHIQNVSAFADPEDRKVFKVNWNKPATSGAFCLQK